jgi:hypothetical protein
MSEGKKIEIEVPVGYELVQDGMNIKFVKKDERFLSWEEKDSKLTGYCVNSFSGVYAPYNYDRNCTTINTFATESQAKGSIALAMLSQQLADFNGEWEPQWGEGTVDKWCINSEFEDGHFVFVVSGGWCYHRFLAFKTKEDAEKFLSTNIDEIKLAKDFI